MGDCGYFMPLLGAPDWRTGCAAGAEALGPQDAPSLWRPSKATASAPTASEPPLNPDGPYSLYMDLPYPAQPRDLIHGPRGPLEAIGPGLCPNYIDQIRDTCPLPDLPRRPFTPGGPVNKDPPLIAPPTLTAAVVRMAASKGLIVVEMTASTTGVAAVEAAAQAANEQQLSSSERATMESLTEQTTYSINTNDSWVIRNQNCGIAPIHAILNNVRGQAALSQLRGCVRTCRCGGPCAPWAACRMALAAC